MQLNLLTSCVQYSGRARQVAGRVARVDAESVRDVAHPD